MMRKPINLFAVLSIVSFCGLCFGAETISVVTNSPYSMTAGSSFTLTTAISWDFDIQDPHFLLDPGTVYLDLYIDGGLFDTAHWPCGTEVGYEEFSGTYSQAFLVSFLGLDLNNAVDRASWFTDHSISVFAIAYADWMIEREFGWNNYGLWMSTDEISTLSVSPIPVPSALLLAAPGLGLVGWLRRQQTLL